ncbi:ABC transporter ATP-binding protein [Chengkuizengella sediminis]|uniref:ABC transporter ATP-binding protein n=1 Tax=Chengkuizengella sediminis TaxID=1885917 RepID=UPI00138A5B84|nr:ABC transporter ATP-binding protein [Chengkuizengella sediminis]NDI33900.1 ABC transporter ATP-binding protein [Chengkuizengella sediminis]
MIKIEKLTQSYGEKVILDNVNLLIEKNELCALVGRNGAGKSTFIHSILGVIPVKKGTIELNHISVKKQSWKRYVSYLPEKFQLYPHLTGKENILFFASLKSDSVNEKHINECLKLVNLFEERNMQLKWYSKGMLQRLGLALMIYFDTEVLILDEPTSGLDPIGRAEILSILKSFSNKTILFSSHHMDEIKEICTHVAYLEHGEIQKYTVADFMNQVVNGGL